MLVSNLNPIVFQSDFVSVRWYGIFLALGILVSILILLKLFKQRGWTTDQTLDLCIWLVVGGLVGARLGEIFFYNFSYYWQNPWEIFFINHGGLSSHGMTLGLLLTTYLYCKVKKISWLSMLDTFIIVVPLLSTFIRIGNFFNSEIVGRVTTLP